MNKKDFSGSIYESIFRIVNQLKCALLSGKILDLQKPITDIDEIHEISGISIERTRLEECKE
jgi:hypothetical protein